MFSCLNYTNKKQDVYVALHILNGWQKIAIIDENQKPSVGIQVNYKPSSCLTLNYSNFLGNIITGSTNAFRTFHNVYAIYDASPKQAFIFGFDIGTQKVNNTKTAVWYTPVIISKINLGTKSKLAARLEYYSDKQQIIIPTATPRGYQTFGASINYDYQISPKILLRSELKKYDSKDPIFKYAQSGNQQTSATVSFIFKI